VDSVTSLCFASLIGKRNTSQAWETCLQHGLLSASSIILRRHLKNSLPSSPEAALRRVNLEKCSISDYVDWIHRDLLPHFHSTDPTTRLSQPIEAICGYLLEATLATEVRDEHPLNSILLSELTLHMASSLLLTNTSSGVELLHRIQSMHSAMTLQVAIWSEWDEHLSYEEIVAGQLNGILSIRLRNRSISNPRDDIRSKIRPLMKRYHPNFDQMLYEWLVHTVQHSVILVMQSPDEGEEVRSDDDGNDDESDSRESIHIKRLVAVAESIEIPNYQAQAIICLLQTLSLPHITARLESYSIQTSPSSCPSLNAKMIQSLFQQLCLLSKLLEGRVSSAIADALAEAFRSYKLRQLAIKYHIKGFNPREPRQVRDAISLILSKIEISTSIPDALCFAEAYSTSGVDISNILVKALIHRILPATPEPIAMALSATGQESHERDHLIRSAMTCIPSDRLQVVLEDTCEYLLTVMGDVTAEAIENKIPAGSVERSTQDLFTSCASGALLISSFFLDHISDGTSGPAGAAAGAAGGGDTSHDHEDTSLSKKGAGGAAGTFPSSLAVGCPFITTDLLSTLKRMRKLILEFSLYLTTQQISDPKVCHEILTRAAIERANEVIEYYFNNEAAGSAGADSHTASLAEVMRQWTEQFLKLRKLTLLLNGSYVSLLSSMMKHCLVKGYMVPLPDSYSPFLSSHHFPLLCVRRIWECALPR
jgi:hypothetical protein